MIPFITSINGCTSCPRGGLGIEPYLTGWNRLLHFGVVAALGAATYAVMIVATREVTLAQLRDLARRRPGGPAAEGGA